MDIDYELLERMCKNKQGIPSWNRTFYVKRAKSCRNCWFHDFDPHLIKSRGCTIFDAEPNGATAKPKGLCIPVRDDSNLSEIHAENVELWIRTNLT